MDENLGEIQMHWCQPEKERIENGDSGETLVAKPWTMIKEINAKHNKSEPIITNSKITLSYSNLKLFSTAHLKGN